MNYIDKGLQLFQAQSLQRKVTLVSSLLVIGGLSAYLFYWSISPDYGVLFHRLDNQAANQILTQLEQASIPYQVQNQGRDILIDKQLIDKTRIKLMGSDLAFSHSTGFELFDKTDFGMTDFSQKINYQRALQGELERTINSLDEVKQARVQLSIPEQHLFQDDTNSPRVAVTLHLNKPLTSLQIKSIQRLITASISHLTLDNVVMVDQNGNGLIADEDDASSNHFSAKKQVEHYLNEKVMQMLHQIFTEHEVMVKIDARLNYDELHRERINPQIKGAITYDKETRHSIPTKSGKSGITQDITQEKNYELGHEKEQFTRANGTIERLSISVVLPRQTPQDKLKQVERLVKSIVGFDLSRGDTISVEALIDKPKLQSNTIVVPISSPPHLTNGSYIVFTGLFISFLLGWTLRRHKQSKHREYLLGELKLWLIDHE